jgi:hypothetical protein
METSILSNLVGDLIDHACTVESLSYGIFTCLKEVI